MRDEPRLLLQDFITDAHNYVSILKAIAQGEQTQLEISNHTGLSQGHISKYLSVLRDTGFVERRVPVTESGEIPPRPLHRYRSLSAFLLPLHDHPPVQVWPWGRWKRCSSQLARKPCRNLLSGTTWRELCQEWVMRASNRGRSGWFWLKKWAREWNKNQVIDVVGISEKEKSLILGDCFWGDPPGGWMRCVDLIKRADDGDLKAGRDRVCSIGCFPHWGWSDRRTSWPSSPWPIARLTGEALAFCRRL